MRISIEEAEGQLTELVRLAQSGEEVVLMENGLPSARLEPMQGKDQSPSSRDALVHELRKPLILADERNPLSPAERRTIIEDIRSKASRTDAQDFPDAARSQDFLYDDDGMPG